MFLLLFFFTGVGNASTFQMVPAIFRITALREAAGNGAAAEAQALQNAGKESAAVLGFTSAVAAYGAFFIPKAYGTSIAVTGGPQAALTTFIVFYASCMAITWWYYTRKDAELRLGSAAVAAISSNA